MYLNTPLKPSAHIVQFGHTLPMLSYITWDQAEHDADIVVFHAGTRHENGKYRTAGGRVLGVTAMEDSHEAAIRKAYEGVAKISFKDMHYRKDIGRK
jgi:phosphoribosylamine--glycine ligase